MKILENLHDRVALDFKEGELDPAKDNEMIAELKKHTKCEVPQEYFNFLHEVNGGVFKVQCEDGGPTEIAFYSIEGVIGFFMDISKSWPGSNDMLPIAHDMGSCILYYGHGKDGFGIYQSFLCAMDYDDDLTYKIANSIKELLVEGIGIDKIFYS